MTERLKQLLDGEAGALPVPPPAAEAVLRQGRGLRRRHRLVVGAGGVAAAVIISGTVAALGGDDDPGRAASDAAATPASSGAAFSYGNHVFYDGPDHEAVIDDKAVKSLYYTSAGLLVRHGDNAWSDGGGPQRFSLVTPGGDVRRLGLETEETVHASDVDQPYVAYAEEVDGDLEVVVYDVSADAEEARVTVGPTTETWFPVSLDGDTVYVSDRSADETFAVDWGAGTAEPSDAPSAWGVTEGRVGTEVDGSPAVVDASNGDVLLTVDDPGYFNLSPDGRYAELVYEGEESADGRQVEFEVYDVDTGSSVTFTGPAYDWGWTADGDRFHVGKNEVRTCDSATGECTTEPYTQPAIPQPPAVTQTERFPICPAELGDDCFTDDGFLESCYDNPDQCEWKESTYVEEQTIDLKLGGRVYES